jgi:hypothetical protein
LAREFDPLNPDEVAAAMRRELEENPKYQGFESVGQNPDGSLKIENKETGAKGTLRP